MTWMIAYSWGIVWTVLTVFNCCWLQSGRMSLLKGLVGLPLILILLFFAAPMMFTYPIIAGLLLSSPLAFILPCRYYRGLVFLIAGGVWVLLLPTDSSTVEAIHQIRAENPLESMSTRLSYETRTKASRGNSTGTGKYAVLATHVARPLQVADLSVDPQTERQSRLEFIHQEQTERFAQAEGFGPYRMLGYSVNKIGEELKQAPSDEPPSSLPEPPAVLSAADEAPGESSAPRPAPSQLQSLHQQGRAGFLNREDFGFIQDRDHVAGFRGHTLRNVPRWEGQEQGVSTDWQITRLELVSLLKHDEPRVYVSRTLPRMKDLGHAPTRPLDGFEQAALKKLRSEQDVVTESSANRVRMLGSLRASKVCQKCHDVQWGELLGAFSYDLDRTRPLRLPPQPRVEPPTT